MNEQNTKPNDGIWKYLIGVLLLFAGTMILRRFISEALAWAIGGFLMTLCIHLAPPRSSLTFIRVLLLGLACAILLFALTRFIG